MSSKDPNELDFFSVNWTLRLYSGETVSTSTWTGASGDMNFNTTTSTAAGVPGHSVSSDGTTTTIWANGGSANTTTTIVNRVTTSLSRQLDETISVACVSN